MACQQKTCAMNKWNLLAFLKQMNELARVAILIPYLDQYIWIHSCWPTKLLSWQQYYTTSRNLDLGKLQNQEYQAFLIHNWPIPPVIKPVSVNFFSKIRNFQFGMVVFLWMAFTTRFLFMLEGFRELSESFFKVINMLFDKEYTLTYTQTLMRVLHKKDLLQCMYMQNIMRLQLLAKVLHVKVIQVHGHLRRKRCSNKNCKKSEHNRK